MKLNIGCGFNRIPGWINCDSDDRVNPDKVMDATKPFPFQTESIDEVFTSHTLEHIDRVTLANRVLPEIWRVCRNNARVTIIVPHMFSQNVLNHVTFFNKDTFRNWHKESYSSSDAFPFKFSFKLENMRISHEKMFPFKPSEICAVLRAVK